MYSTHSLTELSSDHNHDLLELDGWQDHPVQSKPTGLEEVQGMVY